MDNKSGSDMVSKPGVLNSKSKAAIIEFTPNAGAGQANNKYRKRKLPMCGPIWDISDGDFLFGGSDGIAFDSDGNMMMRLSDNMAMDMDSGELHLISAWEQENDDDS